jgi:flagellar motor protein MotB
VAGLVLAMGLVVTGVASARGQSRAIRGSRTAFAVRANLVGKPSPSSTESVWVYLKPRHAAEELATARAVSNPRGRESRHYLSPTQVRERFAPRGRTVSTVRRWLRSAGLHPGAVPANHAYVEARGSVGQIERAFGVSIGLYQVHGKRVLAAGEAPSVPSSIASSILDVAGLDQSPMTALASPPPPPAFVNAGPCSTFWNQQLDTTDPPFGGQPLAYAPCGYTPDQVRSAYGLDTPVSRGADGSGQTVAIVLWYGTATVFADASTYAQDNDPTHPLTSGQFSQQLATSNILAECDPSGVSVEQALDVEAVHATAPGADILYKSAADCTDASLEAAENSIVASHSADIISNSWGECENEQDPADTAAFEQIAMQAAVEGIGIYASSGDQGDEVGDCGSAQADVPAADPFVTAVGGTTDGIDASGQRLFETGWETGFSAASGGAWNPPQFTGGSGGGTSRRFAQPAYQAGVVPDALADTNRSAGDPGRVVPDLAALADPTTGFEIGLTQTFPDGTTRYGQFREGGTSVASPLVAGMMADANSVDGVDHGFVNPALYGVAKPNGGLDDVLPSSGGVVRNDFADGVDAGAGEIATLRTFDDDAGLVIHDTAGYNDVTGLGSPNGPVLLAVQSLSLTPDSTQGQPDVPVHFKAHGVDGLGAGFDATQTTSLSISPAGGVTGASCTTGACSATGPGTYTVTATYAGSAPAVNGQPASATATFTVIGPPSVTITAPADGTTYSVGRPVQAAYDCSDAAGAPGLVAGGAGCSGSTLVGAAIDTSTPGAHTFTVTGSSQDGQQTTRSVHYTVAAAPSTTTPTSPGPRASGGAPPPPPTISISPGAAGLTYRLSAGRSHPASRPISRYVWTLGGRRIGNGPTIRYTFPRAGRRYRLVLTITDPAGHTSSTAITFTPRVRRTTAQLTLHFARNRAALEPRSERHALALLRPLFAHAARVHIAGYCAAAEVNRSLALRRLSTERAQAVLRFLTAHHNHGARHVTVSGQGATAFAASNDTARGRAANRRATVVIEYEKPLR